MASDESVTDAMTGKPLEFHVVDGVEARKDPLMAKADQGYGLHSRDTGASGAGAWAGTGGDSEDV